MFLLFRIKKIYGALSRVERLIFWIAIALAAISATILISIFVQNSTKEVPAGGGTFVEGILGQPSFINPVIARSDVDKALVRLFFSNLGELAAKVESDQDGRTWSVRLKDNVFWHDGERLTSDDVVFTVQNIQNPDSNSPLFVSWQGVVVERISELEIKFNLGSPYAFLGNNLKNLYILPKHLFADIPPANWRLSEYNLKPIGSGPYVFQSLEKESDGFVNSYRAKANRNYFEDPAFISSFTVRFFSIDAKESLVEAINSGRVDGAANFEPDDLIGIKRPHQIFQFELPSYYAVFINQNQNLALKEKGVREALSLAINRKDLAEKIFEGFGGIAYGPVPPGIPLTIQGDTKEAFSQASATELLDKSGWKTTEDGSRAKKVREGTIPLEFNLTAPDVPLLKKTADWLKASWEKIGVKVNLSILPPDELRERIIKNRDYQTLLFGHILNSDFDLYSFWHSSERFYPGLNLSLYNSPKADKIIESMRQTLDPEKRATELKALQATITDDFPAIFLYSPSYLYVASNDLRGINPRLISEPASRFDNIREWHVKTKRVFK